jgi:hypothetical protein
MDYEMAVDIINKISSTLRYGEEYEIKTMSGMLMKCLPH